MKDFSSLLCLTSDDQNISHAEQVRILIEEGARFIQLRSKVLSSKNILAQIDKVSEDIRKYDVTLIINDHLNVANESIANGVHLGIKDQSVTLARKSLAKGSVIGSTVHNFEEALAVKELNLCDYVGLGPFRVSKTKFNLAPLLSMELIRQIIDILSPIPVFLIGGITLSDCDLIEDLNLGGLAVCAGLSSSNQFACNVKSFINQIPIRNLVQI